MYKIKAEDGTNNVCGKNLKRVREGMEMSQRQLAVHLQNNGCDMDHYAVRRIENGERYVTDIEICLLAGALKVSVKELLGVE